MDTLRKRQDHEWRQDLAEMNRCRHSMGRQQETWWNSIVMNHHAFIEFEKDDSEFKPTFYSLYELSKCNTFSVGNFINPRMSKHVCFLVPFMFLLSSPITSPSSFGSGPNFDNSAQGSVKSSESFGLAGCEAGRYPVTRQNSATTSENSLVWSEGIL